MRIRVQIIVEDIQNRMKNSKESVVEVPRHMLHEGVDPASQVRGTAEWALGHAVSAVQGALNPQMNAYPGAPVGASPAPGQMPGQAHQAMHGGRVNQGVGGVVPPRAQVDEGRVPRTAEEIISQSMHGVRAAIGNDRVKGASFLDPSGNPSKGLGDIGWGPHRSK